jgi:hypothetical protein
MANDVGALRAASDHCGPRPPGADAMNNIVFVLIFYGFLTLSARQGCLRNKMGYPGIYYTGFNDTLHSFRAIFLAAVAVAPRVFLPCWKMRSFLESRRVGDVPCIDLSLHASAPLSVATFRFIGLLLRLSLEQHGSVEYNWDQLQIT